MHFCHLVWRDVITPEPGASPLAWTQAAPIVRLALTWLPRFCVCFSLWRGDALLAASTAALILAHRHLSGRRQTTMPTVDLRMGSLVCSGVLVSSLTLADCQLCGHRKVAVLLLAWLFPLVNNVASLLAAAICPPPGPPPCCDWHCRSAEYSSFHFTAAKIIQVRGLTLAATCRPPGPPPRCGWCCWWARAGCWGRA